MEVTLLECTRALLAVKYYTSQGRAFLVNNSGLHASD